MERVLKQPGAQVADELCTAQSSREKELNLPLIDLNAEIKKAVIRSDAESEVEVVTMESHDGDPFANLLVPFDTSSPEADILGTQIDEVDVSRTEVSDTERGTLTWALHLTLADGVSGHEAASLDEFADELARAAGLENQGQIGELAGHYLFALPLHRRRHRDLWETRGIRKSINAVFSQHNSVRWHAEQKLLKRSKRSSLHFNDPKYPFQWHLHNRRKRGMDINVTGVWERNVTGEGVTVVV
ncbi:hypothetical protein scyTo_0014037, partial [Scyliorhinus torazame]|nr:hypothetical protein [Scyliorhinus torazame]